MKGVRTMAKVKSLVLLFLTVAFLAGGCIVTSLHPLYTQDDIIFDESLVGSWRQKNDNTTWMFKKTENNRYQLFVFDEDGSGEFEACLMRLEEYLFLDLTPAEPENTPLNDFYFLHLVPTHSFMKVELDENTLILGFISLNWFEDLSMKKKDIGVKYEVRDDDMILMTAPTEELKQFVLTNAEKEGFFEFEPLVRQE